MGVSGSEKTTVAALLAVVIGCQFQEDDDLHPSANVEKMHSGMPLTDADRLSWLRKIAEKIDLGAPRAGTSTIGDIIKFLNNLMGAAASITTAYTVGATHSFTGPFVTAGVVLIVGILAYVFLLDQLDPIPNPRARGALDTPVRVR